jgi:hypothetical protein
LFQKNLSLQLILCVVTINLKTVTGDLQMGCSWWSPQTVAVVTGGNKGIGHEIVTQLATQGITVIIGARDNERGLAAAQGFHSKGLTNVQFHQLDITDSESVTAFADWIQRTYGGLDILVSQFVRLPIIHYDSGFSSLVPSVTILAHPLHIETHRRFFCFVAYASISVLSHICLLSASKHRTEFSKCFQTPRNLGHRCLYCLP